MQTLPERIAGPGAPTPKPLCIAYVANALSPYSLQVIEGNNKAVCLSMQRSGCLCRAILTAPTTIGSSQAEAPERAL